MEQNKTTKIKTLKIGKFEIKGSIPGFISLGIMIVLLIIYIFSPKAFLITTARYGAGSESDNQNVITALGAENTEENFNLYFQWYNVVHELGHGMITFHGERNLVTVEDNANNEFNIVKFLEENSENVVWDVYEEQLVNDFALAYWMYMGEDEKIQQLETVVNHALEHIDSDAKEGQNYISFAIENWNKSSFNTFNNYGWFQYSCVKNSLENRKTLDVVLREMGITDFDLSKLEKKHYGEINEETSKQIVQDVVINFKQAGLEFPKTYQKFSNNPNTNYSVDVKNFLGIYDLIYR